jgi:putative transposase
MNKEYKHGNRNKYLLRYHLILVCKYRRHLLSANNISSDMKTLAKTISNKHNVRIHYMEVDKDHLKHSSYHSKCFWKEKTFWSDGYFISSIGEVSGDTLKHYIENQGKNT